MGKKIRIGALISGRGTNLEAIAEACDSGNVDARVVFVGSDNPDAGGLVWAKNKHYPILVVNYKEIAQQVKTGMFRSMPSEALVEVIHKKSVYVHDWYDGNRLRQLNHITCKIAAEQELIKKMSGYGIDLLVLAGFMQNCTAKLIDFMNMGYGLPRIMNIHPALLPSFPGVDGYGDTIRYGCKVAGSTVHFINYDEDTGPIIGQRAIPVLPNDTVDSLREKGLKEECNYKILANFKQKSLFQGANTKKQTLREPPWICNFYMLTLLNFN